MRNVAAADKGVNLKIHDVSSATLKLANNSTKIVDIVNNIKEINHKGLGSLQGIAASSERQLASMQQINSSVEVIEKVSKELLEVIKE